MNLKRSRGLTLLMSCLINLCIGSAYSWSVFAGPLAERLTALGGAAYSASDLGIVFTVYNIPGPFCMTAGGWLNRRIEVRRLIQMGSVLFVAGLLLCSRATTLGGLVVGFGLLVGVGVGTVYGCTVNNSVKLFPDKRGLAGGLTTGVYGKSNADNLTASATGASTPAAEADISSDRNEDSRKASSEVDETSEASSAASEVSPVPEASVTSEPTVSPEPKGMIALTFDDGPSDFTDRLLDCLEANNVKATFFLAGQEVEYFQEPVKRMEELGCEIGNHSYDHPDLTTLSADDAASQLSRTDQLIQDLTGHIATVVRPPYGSYNDTVAETAARPLILWSVDTLDWETQNADSTVQNVMDNASDGQIILMHDIFKESVDAAEIFIPQLLQEGYQLVTVSELAAAKGITLENGTAYGSVWFGVVPSSNSLSCKHERLFDLLTLVS